MDKGLHKLRMTDACTRLVYEPLVLDERDGKIHPLTIDYRSNSVLIENIRNVEEYKLILFDISCLTRKITLKGETFTPMKSDRLRETEGYLYLRSIIEGKVIPNHNFLRFDVIELFNEWHINYRLPRGMFVPVSGSFNPYA